MRLIIPILLTSILSWHSCSQATEAQNPANAMERTENDQQEPPKLLRHVVLFNFNDTTPEDTIRQIEQAFASLPGKIPEIYSFEWGTNNSPEGLDKGLTHCFLVTFLSEADRAIYLPHPAHQEFVELVGPYVEDVTVVDYWKR
jgi:hypothetical protein